MTDAQPETQPDAQPDASLVAALLAAPRDAPPTAIPALLAEAGLDDPEAAAAFVHEAAAVQEEPLGAPLRSWEMLPW